MKIHDVEQGSIDWKSLRLGMPTASNFHKIMTPAKRNASTQRKGYMHELLAEWLLGQPLDDASSGFMDRGSRMEDEAISWYEFDRNVDVHRVGLVTAEPVVNSSVVPAQTAEMGCSPDGMIGDISDGGELVWRKGLETKCYGAKRHVEALLRTTDSEHSCQVQGAMLITGLDSWDRLYYHPTMPSICRTIERDEAFIADLSEHLAAFARDLEVAKRVLIERGCKPRKPMKEGEVPF